MLDDATHDKTPTAMDDKSLKQTTGKAGDGRRNIHCRVLLALERATSDAAHLHLESTGRGTLAFDSDCPHDTIPCCHP